MTRYLFAPALALMKHLPLPLSFALVVVLLLLQAAIGIWSAPATDLRLAPVLAAVAAALLGIYLVSALYYWTAGGMERLRSLLERIASGDVTLRIDDRAAGTLGSKETHLWRSLARMSDGLREIASQVRASADTIAERAKDVSEGNTNLSQRTQEQAASLEETASAMEELAATIKQNADNCERANGLAGKASRVATETSEGMRELTETMKTIKDSSRRVADILGTIEDIAFQTNILALNAAVEAARAGEHGRGFAVVAAEVRALASRSAAAAKETKGLIDASVGSVTQGAELVDRTGTTMHDVVTSVQEVSEVIGEIAAASAEQSAGVENINKAILQMDSVTQQNATLVEEAASTALAFEDEATRLLDVVSAFKVDRMEERDRAVALVHRAVAHVKAKGVEQACRDFNDPQGGFNDGKYYIWASDFHGVTIANGATPEVCGQNHYHVKSVDGRPFIQEMLQTAKTKGKGWSEYLWKNPATKRTEQKSTYFESVGDIVVSCGIYKGKKAARRPSEPTSTNTAHNVVDLRASNNRTTRQ